MGLSAREQRILSEIEHDLAAAEPRLKRALVTARLPMLNRRSIVTSNDMERSPRAWIAGMPGPVRCWLSSAQSPSATSAGKRTGLHWGRLSPARPAVPSYPDFVAAEGLAVNRDSVAGRGIVANGPLPGGWEDRWA
jgi:hypothetical protein